MGEVTVRDPSTRIGASVNSNGHLLTHSVVQADSSKAVDDDRAYNLNTGWISVTGTAETAILYLKNNESTPIFIEALALGVSSASGGFADICEFKVIRNPTTGTILTGTPDNVDMNINRLFSSASTLTADVYKGTDGDTFTNGTDGLLIAQNGTGRVYAGLEMVVGAGGTVGITFNPQLTSGSVNVYAAIICHVEQT